MRWVAVIALLAGCAAPICERHPDWCDLAACERVWAGDDHCSCVQAGDGSVSLQCRWRSVEPLPAPIVLPSLPPDGVGSCVVVAEDGILRLGDCPSGMTLTFTPNDCCMCPDADKGARITLACCACEGQR